MEKQLDIFGNDVTTTNQKVVITDGEYIYIPEFFNKQDSDNFFVELYNGIEWRQDEMKMYGKTIKFPRLTAWYGDNDKSYSFSGLKLDPKPWTDSLKYIKAAIERKSDAEFNSVLLNLYRNGQDSISWHHDNEKELGINPVIASVNFGEIRTFQFRHITTGEKKEIRLQHGSLLIMSGRMQHYWQHQVPKTKIDVKARINLTFRVIK